MKPLRLETGVTNISILPIRIDESQVKDEDNESFLMLSSEEHQKLFDAFGLIYAKY